MDRVSSDGVGVASPTARTLVISSDPLSVDELSRLCAAAAVDADVVRDAARAGRRWTRASCVLVGEECAAEIAAMRLRHRPDVWVVGRSPAAADVWQRAVQIGAADVAVLPADAGRIADLLAEAASRDREPALVVAVVGAGGGSGASTVAASLASALAPHRGQALLVDADPLGGGIDLLMGCESAPGLRWPDIDVGDGRVAASALLAALPAVGGVSVLSASPTTAAEIDSAAVRTMISAGRRACDLVVVDLPRRFQAPVFAAAAAEADVVLAVVASEVRSIAAGRHVVGAAADSCADVRVVVRTTAGRRIEPEAAAEALGVPLAGTVPSRKAVSRSADEGSGVLRGLGARRRYGTLLAGLRRTDSIR